MKKLFLLLFSVLIITGSNAYSADNVLRFNAEIPRLTSFEYERKAGIFLPGLSGFINFGSGSIDLDEVESDVSGLNFGVRYRVPFLGYLSLGYGNLDVNYSYVETVTVGAISAGSTVSVDAKFSGLLIEYGNELGIGPVVVGGKLFYLMGQPDISASADGTPVSDSDIDEGAATIDGIPGFAVYAGFSF
ncbi:MAG: hypothetical protein VW397_01255 [Candidatus Margulisiibacteriota bacterium]